MRKLALIGLVALGGCEDPTEPVVCTAAMVPGIVVEVRDAVTEEPAASKAMLIVQEGAFADTARAEVTEAVEIAAAYERPGTYRVEVQHPEYQPWVREDVRVEDRLCHVETVRLTAELEREAAAELVR